METLIVVFFIGILAALVTPVAGKWIRRSEDMAAIATVRQVLAVARLEAVKRTANVVVEIKYAGDPDDPSDKRIRLHTFQDRANDPIPTCAGGSNVGNPCALDRECPGSTCKTMLPGSSTIPPTDEALAAGNCVQDIGKFATSPATDEPTLGLGMQGQTLTPVPAPAPPPPDVILSQRIHFWKQGGSKDDIADAVRFNKYADIPDGRPPSCDSSTHRVIFLPGGGISIPLNADSGPVPNPSSPNNERGIYFADWQGKNYFRVTVDSDLSGKARVDKYNPGSQDSQHSGYVASGWKWQ